MPRIFLLFVTLLFVSSPFSSRDWSLFARASSKTQKAQLVIFMSHTCPCSLSHESHLTALHSKFAKQIDFKGIQISTDDPKALDHYQSLGFPVHVDENSQLARDFKALRTPHAFLLNKNGETVYKGAVSNRSLFSPDNELYLANALRQFIAGDKISMERTKPVGCLIPRK